jgi:hypothetical protein
VTSAVSRFLSPRSLAIAFVVAKAVRTVKIRPDYGYCNSCADKMERGWDI